MKKKNGGFCEKLCVTVSSQVSAHRKPVSFTIRRGVAVIAAIVLVAVVAVCAIIAIRALRAADGLNADAESLRQKIERQESALESYTQPDENNGNDGQG